MSELADLPKRQSTRLRKPTVPFEEQSLKPSTPLKSQKPPAKPNYSTQKASTSKSKTSEDDNIQLLCNKTKVLHIEDVQDTQILQKDNVDNITDEKEMKKAKKKAKMEELARLGNLSFEDIVKMIPNISNVVFEPFSCGRH